MSATNVSETERSTGLPIFWQPLDDWTTLKKGQEVEIYTRGLVSDRGRVDAVMADGTMLWLMQEGAIGRRIIENQTGTSIRCSFISLAAIQETPVAPNR